MGRLVQPAKLERIPVRGSGGLESTGSTQNVAVGGDNYQDRIAKYIPGEVVAAYMALDRMLVPDPDTFRAKAKALSGQLESVGASAAGTALFKNPSTLLTIHNSLPLLILLIGLIFTPLYIRQLALNEGGGASSWRSHALIATFAFAVWAYAIQGSAFTLGHLQDSYVGVWASAMLIVFTLASGLFGPPPLRAPDGAR
jgi:hypothetical protein